MGHLKNKALRHSELDLQSAIKKAIYGKESLHRCCTEQAGEQKWLNAYREMDVSSLLEGKAYLSRQTISDKRTVAK